MSFLALRSRAELARLAQHHLAVEETLRASFADLSRKIDALAAPTLGVNFSQDGMRRPWESVEV